MNDPIQEKIKSFAKDSDRQIHYLAMLKVGYDKGDSAPEIMSRVIAAILLDFNRIPIKLGQS